MEISLIDPQTPPPCARAYTVSMTVLSFKGRKDVVVHLFRPEWDPAQENEVDWDNVLDRSQTVETSKPGDTRKVVMECFTLEERDRIMEYLKEHYATRLSGISAACLAFPLPMGLAPFTQLEEGKSVGFIRFEKIPHFNLPFALRGYYDLSSHRPIVDTGDDA